MSRWQGRQIGPYTLVEKLGLGGMGVVYKARDTILDRDVALKMLLVAGDDAVVTEHRRRMLLEAKAAARIKSRHVAQVIQFGETDEGELYIVMELLEGRSLAQVLDHGAALEPISAVRIARQIAKGMAAAHALGVVHRDLKPGNVMLIDADGETDVAKILDFGIAKVQGDSNALTQNGAVVGTMAFMAPEQVLGRPVDARTDVYALGCILYRMLAGTHAFGSKDLVPVELMRRHLEDAPQPLRERVPDAGIPVALDNVVMQAMSKAPDDRFDSMNALDFALATAMNLETSSSDRAAPAPSRSYPPSPVSPGRPITKPAPVQPQPQPQPTPEPSDDDDSPFARSPASAPTMRARSSPKPPPETLVEEQALETAPTSSMGPAEDATTLAPILIPGKRSPALLVIAASLAILVVSGLAILAVSFASKKPPPPLVTTTPPMPAPPVPEPPPTTPTTPTTTTTTTTTTTPPPTTKATTEPPPATATTTTPEPPPATTTTEPATTTKAEAKKPVVVKKPVAKPKDDALPGFVRVHTGDSK